MRRSCLLVLSLIYCYCLLVIVVAKDSSDNDSVRLRVSIRKDPLKTVPSCQHTFSQVELLNLHSSEPIMIHSIQTAPEETVLIRSASGATAEKSWDDDVIPQQLHVSRLPSGSLSLGPGQVAIVPVTFLPRYPLLEHENVDGSYRASNPPHLSGTARADLVQIVGEDILDQAEYITDLSPSLSPSASQRRSNLDPAVLPEGDEFEVSTTVVVDTSRGVVKLPISASSVRQNSYGIPDVIRFHHSEPPEERASGPSSRDSEMSKNSPWNMKQSTFGEKRAGIHGGVVLIDTLYARHEGVQEKQNYTPSEPDRDCYDLFLSNPLADRELEISEVLISRPELMSVEFDPRRLLLTPDIMLLSTDPAQVIREWTEDGPMYLPPDSEDNYIATVCTCVGGGVEKDETSGIYLQEMANWIDSGNPDHSLGFLQIRTDSETLFVGLERAEELSHSGRANSATNHNNQSSSLGTTKLNSSIPNLSSSALLKAVPDHVDFHLMSTASPAAVSKVGLQNKSPVPIRIMRVAVGMDTTTNHDHVKTAERIGLRMNVGVGNHSFVDVNVVGEADAAFESFVLPPAITVDDALVLKCSVSWDSSFISFNRESFQFTGSILLRGTMDTELKYNEWRDEMLKNPYRDFHLVLEIPYSISVLNGRLEVIIERSTHPYPQIWRAQPWDKSGRAVSALFFPMTQFEVMEDPEDPLPTQKYRGSDVIGHDLRIMSNMAISLRLEGAEIYDDQDGDPTTQGRRDSLCRRFNVSRTDAFPATSKYPGFEEFGFLALQYSFGQQGKNRPGQRRWRGSETQDPEQIYPTTCYLHVVTSPVDTGIHRIPLVIFPGQLDGSIPTNHPGNPVERSLEEKSEPSEVESGVPVTAILGFDRLLAWFRSSVVGNSLRSHLELVTDDKRSYKDDAHLLAKYLWNVCKRSSGLENLTLRPILLKAGAIEHSEMVRTPLYLTNHNPVPISVTIEVGEVEGMTIALGRDASSGYGDGNNILDYLPRTSSGIGQSERNVLVEDGMHEGHPVNGLRQFLLSNEEALSFSSQFPFRDAISINRAAVTRQPLLWALYKWHSHVEFHRGLLPNRFQPDFVSSCKGSLHPPLYSSSFNSAEKRSRQQLPGPFMISGDKSIAQPLMTCWESNIGDPDMSDGSKIVIPPGGVARFEVRVRAPPDSFLENDISQFLATGLVLSTNHGEVMPIVATFEALQGQLHVSHLSTPVKAEPGCAEDISTIHESNNIKVIGVPLGLNWESSQSKNNATSKALTIPPALSDPQLMPNDKIVLRDRTDDSRGVSLFLRSSFSREVRLLKVESCNPWFEVVLRESMANQEFDENLGINIGALHSVVSCDPSHDDTEQFPSYYQCALNWLANRSDLQPRGCGLLPALQKRHSEDENSLDATHCGVDRAVKAFERALRVLKKAQTSTEASREGVTSSNLLLEVSPNNNLDDSVAMKSGTRRRDGFLAPLFLNVFAEAWDAWIVAAEYGLRFLSSSLRATIEYDTFSGGASDQRDIVGRQSLALSMHDLAVESVLSTPKLFDCRRAKEKALVALSPDDESPSIIEFPSTLVATVASLTIPLRNPTSVPVRVRIGTTPSNVAMEREAQRQGEKFGIDENLRDRFLQGLEAPYVQNGQVNPTESENAQHLWWDGDGAFFVSDERGDVVRSHHNITIRAGAGAHVSLVNPSLHANVAFLVGCGARCGVRDDPQTKVSEHVIDPKLTSPMGAAAAAGISLIGRKRSHLPQVNAIASDEPNVLAGGSALPGSGGPAAFAVPYSALDEIVIPPHGTGEVGPIFFRPPGRFGVLGCESAIESAVSHWGVKMSKVCESQSFEAMIFLENSLTGLERIVLRGKGLWERLYFLDPLPEKGNDAFGDIEFRNGRPTLLFPGTSEKNIKSHPAIPQSRWRDSEQQSSVIKEVLLHNGGDVLVDVSYVYFSDTSKVIKKRWRPVGAATEACRFGSFRLLNCWESDESTFHVDGEQVHNIRAGFEIRPGENRSLFIEHIPDCAKQEMFISLNVEYRRQNPSSGFSPNLDPGILSLSRTGEVRNSKTNDWKRSFRKRKIDLLVGYDMGDREFVGCTPADPGTELPVAIGNNGAISSSGKGNKMTENRSYSSILSVRRSRVATLVGKILLLCLVLIVLASSVSLLAQSWKLRHQASESFWSTLRGARTKNEASDGSALHQAPNVTHSNWQAAFRCLARADPTSTELQTLGREQIRQVIIGRYRTIGVLPPQCFNSAGVFSRERVGTTGSNASRLRNGKDGGVGGNERIRTLSDAIFQNFSILETGSIRRRLPAGVGWRTAFTRGIINESSISRTPCKLKTKILLVQRNKTAVPDLANEVAPPNDYDAVSENEYNVVIENKEHEETRISLTKEESDGPGESVDTLGDVVSTSDSEGAELTKGESSTTKDLVDSKGRQRRDAQPSKAGPSGYHAPKQRQSASNGEKKNIDKKPTERETRRRNTARSQSAAKGTPPVGPSRKANHRKDTSDTANDVSGSSRVASKVSGRDKGKASSSYSSKKQHGAQSSSEVPRNAGEGNNVGRKRKSGKGDRSTGGPKQQQKPTQSASTSNDAKSKTAVSSSFRSRGTPSGKKQVSRSPGRSASPQSPSSTIEGSPHQTSEVVDSVLRPPPGLAPPPGFGRDDSQNTGTLAGNNPTIPMSGSGQTSLGPMLTAVYSNTDLNLNSPRPAAALPFSQAATGRGDLLFTGSIGDSRADIPYSVASAPGGEGHLPLTEASSPSLGAVGTARETIGLGSAGFGLSSAPEPSLDPIIPLLDERTNNSMDGFDVMDFLDGILNDGSTHDEEPAEAAGPGVLLSNSSTVPLYSNPWASEGSRAAAYGISFDNAEGEDHNSDTSPNVTLRATAPPDDQSALANIPLLTPAALLSIGNEEDAADDKGNSFYASLMDE